MNFRVLIPTALVSLLTLASNAFADDVDVAKAVQEVVAAAGGEEKLLKLFQFRERVLITATPAAPPAADEKGNRTSTVEVSSRWWLGKAPRDKDKVRVLCWAWSLRILIDPKSKVAALPETTIGDTPAVGFRVTEAVKEPIDLYFNKSDKHLLAIDYTDTRHVFSEWKKTTEGHVYPSHVTGYRFTDKDKKITNDKQWYQTDILELTPLKELPSELAK